MSYPAFVYNNPATIAWAIVDANGDPVTGAAVTVTLWRDRSLDNPDTIPGTQVPNMIDLVLAEGVAGFYSIDVPAVNVPQIGTNYVLVIQARVAGILIRNWEEDTSVNAVSDRNPLCSIEAVKDHLNIDATDSTQDAQLNRVILATSANFLNMIRRPGFYPSRNRTTVIEVDNWQTESRMEDLFLPHYPINSVTSVTINELVLPELDPTTPDVLGWVFDPTQPDEDRQKLTLRGLYWPIFETWMSPRRPIYRPSPMRVTVVYNAGYTDVPADVEQAIVEWVAYKKGLRELQAMDQTTQWLQLGQFQQNTSIASSTLKASTIAMPTSVSDVISIYQRPVI
jgi:hypothetical protein